MKKITLLFAASTLAVNFAAPALAIDLNPLSAIKGIVEAAVEDRKASDIGKDAEIKAKITSDVIDKMGSDVISINSDVYEQDVMLTGSVETSEQKALAAKLAGAVENVKKVYNEIRVEKDVDKKKGTVENAVDDTVIETKINALLIDAKGVNVTNLRYRSVGGHVYLFGRALSSAERSKAITVVKEIENVLSVTNRIKVRAK